MASGAASEGVSISCRVEGVKRVTLAAVGEKHSLALQSWCSAPISMCARLAPAQSLSSRPMSGLSDRDSSMVFSEALSGPLDSLEGLLAAEARPRTDSSAYWRSLEAVPGPGSRQVPPLQFICQLECVDLTFLASQSLTGRDASGDCIHTTVTSQAADAAKHPHLYG